MSSDRRGGSRTPLRGWVCGTERRCREGECGWAQATAHMTIAAHHHHYPTTNTGLDRCGVACEEHFLVVDPVLPQ